MSLWNRRLLPYLQKCSNHVGYTWVGGNLYVVGISTKLLKSAVESFRRSNPDIMVTIDIGSSFVVRELRYIY